MKPMTYKELGEKVAEQALDDYLINGKTMREWINILSDNMSVLEQIRAEIEQTADNYNPMRDAFDGGYVMAIKDVLQIIDKYMKGEKGNE